jgi:hypothetical protein
VSDLCGQYRIQPSLFYNGQKQFFEHGAAAFEQVQSAPEKHQERTIAALRASDVMSQRRMIVTLYRRDKNPPISANAICGTARAVTTTE